MLPGESTGGVYRPPPSKKNKLTRNMFYTDFSKFMEVLTNCDQPLFISGDFSFHLDNNLYSDTMKFMGMLDSKNLIQKVSGATHASRTHT